MRAAIVDLPQPDVPTTEMRMSLSLAVADVASRRAKQIADQDLNPQNYFPIGLAQAFLDALYSVRTYREQTMLQPAPETPCAAPLNAAFRERNPRSAREKTKINLRGFIKPQQILRRKPPKLPNKNKGGAPAGNRNALSHGLYSKEMRDLRRTSREAIARLNMAAALLRAEAARMDSDTFVRLSEAGLSRRVLWTSEH
jgi:hypothetical protein